MLLKTRYRDFCNRMSRVFVKMQSPEPKATPRLHLNLWEEGP